MGQGCEDIQYVLKRGAVIGVMGHASYGQHLGGGEVVGGSQGGV